MSAGASLWPRLMALGLGALRLSPDDFWSMTPHELELALKGAFENGAAAPETPMRRDQLEALRRAYPDKEPDHE